MMFSELSYSLKRFIVCISTGRPLIGRNCLGTLEPMRSPLPPATITT